MWTRVGDLVPPMRTLFLVALLVAVPVVAQATPHGPCDPPGAIGILTLGSGGAGTVYVDVRGVGSSQGVWTYIESNSIAHLQRGGASPVPGDADACFDDSASGPDMLVY